MLFTRREFVTWAASAASAFMISLAMTLGASAAEHKAYVMKIALPTLDDTLHQYAKNYAAGREDFEPAIKSRNLSRDDGLDRATD